MTCKGKKKNSHVSDLSEMEPHESLESAAGCSGSKRSAQGRCFLLHAGLQRAAHGGYPAGMFFVRSQQRPSLKPQCLLQWL